MYTHCIKNIIMKRFSFVSIYIIVLLCASSCSKDYLNRPPLGIQTDDNFYTSPGAGFKSVINCYLGFYNFWGYQAALAELGDMATDDCDKGGSDAGDRPFVADLGYGRAQSTNETLQNWWSACYAAIGNCDLTLEHLPDAKLIDDKGNPVDESVKKRYIAEARFLRAFFYFDLVRVFGGVPLVTKTLSVEDRNKLTRSSAMDIFKFITDEWAACIPDLPSKNQLSADELGRATKEAVWAFTAQADLFFAKEDNSLYAKAAEAAKEVIDSKAFALDPNYQDLFLEDGYKSKEAVFPVIFGDKPASFIYGSNLPIYCSPRSAGGWGFDCPTQSLVSEFEKGDPRLLFTVLDQGDVFPKVDGSRDVLDFTVSPNTGYYNRKVFLIDARRGNGWGDDAFTLHLMRYSDVLLMYAEALLESGGSKQEVADYINMVRKRASNSSHTDVEAVKRVRVIANQALPLVNTSDDLEAAVRHERRVEFGGEYERLFDLIRWGTYVSAMHTFATKPYSNGKGAAFKEPAGGGRYVFPIPQVEIDRSGGSIVQNPGY
jgi:hypothetical protein